MESEQKKPLLDAFWNDASGAQSLRARILTMESIEKAHPNQVVAYLREHGVVKLADARIYASDVDKLFGRQRLATTGSAHSSHDWELDWGIDPLPCADTLPEQDQHPRYSLDQASSGPAVLMGAGDGGAHAVTVGGAGRRAGARHLHRQIGHRYDHLPVPTVTVESYLVTVRDAAAPGERGLLGPLLHRWQLGSCSSSAFGLPAVQAVVQYKWRRFAQVLLLVQLGVYALWVGSFVAFLLLMNWGAKGPGVNPRPAAPGKFAAALACQLLSLAAMLPFLAGELVLLRAYGLRRWLNVGNTVDVVTYGVQTAMLVLFLVPLSRDLLTAVTAAQAVLLTVRLTYFSRVFRSTTFDFMGSLGYVMRDAGWYLTVMLLMMWGFAAAFYTVFRGDKDAYGFESLSMSLLTMLNYAVGGSAFSARALVASSHPTTALVLCMVYQFAVSMCLMSLLTGVMANSLMRASQEEEVAMVLNRAQVIDELETVLPSWLISLAARWGDPAPLARRSGSARRAAPGPSAPSASSTDDGTWRGRLPVQPTGGDLSYVKVLRVDPASLERIDGKEKLWPAVVGGDTSMARKGSRTDLQALQPLHRGAGPAAGGPGAAPSGATVAALQVEVGELRGQIAELTGLVRQLLVAREGGGGQHGQE